MVSPIEENGGTLKDAAGNSADLTYTLPNTSSITVHVAGIAVLEWQDNAGNPIASHDYGTPGVDTTVTVRVATTGTVTSGTVTVTVTDSDLGHFTVVTDNCSTFTIAGGSFCTVDIKWNEIAPTGVRTGSIEATSVPGGTDALSLQGTKL